MALTTIPVSMAMRTSPARRRHLAGKLKLHERHVKTRERGA
jgi:hypothetical protein